MERSGLGRPSSPDRAGQRVWDQLAGLLSASFIEAYGKAKKAAADHYSDTIKLILVLGHRMLENYNGTYQARARTSVLRNNYDEAFGEVDFLVMPTSLKEGCSSEHRSDAARALNYGQHSRLSR